MAVAWAEKASSSLLALPRPVWLFGRRASPSSRAPKASHDPPCHVPPMLLSCAPTPLPWSSCVVGTPSHLRGAILSWSDSASCRRLVPLRMGESKWWCDKAPILGASVQGRTHFIVQGSFPQKLKRFRLLDGPFGSRGYATPLGWLGWSHGCYRQTDRRSSVPIVAAANRGNVSKSACRRLSPHDTGASGVCVHVIV